MSKATHTLRTRLGQVRGLGSAKEGTSHFWWQRLSALALAPLTFWFTYSICRLATGGETGVAEWLANPCAALLMIVFVSATFLHAKLGIQVIIEDYVHHEPSKMTLLLTNLAAFILFELISVLAVLRLHFLDVVSGSM